jgi:hypothetical protein
MQTKESKEMKKEILNQIKENSLNLTEKEKNDVFHALYIMEKVTAEELVFANHVLMQLKIKTMRKSDGHEYTRKYPELNELEKLHGSFETITIKVH